MQEQSLGEGTPLEDGRQRPDRRGGARLFPGPKSYPGLCSHTWREHLSHLSHCSELERKTGCNEKEGRKLERSRGPNPLLLGTTFTHLLLKGPHTTGPGLTI